MRRMRSTSPHVTGLYVTPEGSEISTGALLQLQADRERAFPGAHLELRHSLLTVCDKLVPAATWQKGIGRTLRGEGQRLALESRAPWMQRAWEQRHRPLQAAIEPGETTEVLKKYRVLLAACGSEIALSCKRNIEA